MIRSILRDGCGLGLGLVLAVWSTIVVARAQTQPNFAGTWVFNAARSQNVGMMASMEDTVTIVQSATRLSVTDRTRMQGRDSTRDTHFDLTGKPVINPGPIGDQNETVAKWVDDTLVVTWTADGAVAGTKVVRTETRSLSPDGKTMTVESVRGSNAPVVMVFEKR